MQTFFLVTFVTGASFVVFGFLLGLATAHVHLPGAAHIHVHLPIVGPLHLAHGASHLATKGSGPSISPLNFSTVMTFVAWFGGVGYLLTLAGLALWITLPVALLAGLFAASLVCIVLVKVIAPGQTPPLRLEDYRMEGTVAKVSVPIGQGRTGEIVYVRNGCIRSEGARDVRGGTLPRGTEVVIHRYDRGVAYVESVDRLLAERTVGGAARLPEKGGQDDEQL